MKDIMSYIYFMRFRFRLYAALIVFSPFSTDMSSLQDSYVICCNFFCKYQIPNGIKTNSNRIHVP